MGLLSQGSVDAMMDGTEFQVACTNGTHATHDLKISRQPQVGRVTPCAPH
ncbi:hypothetical protein Cflav_PD6343 [Pedosphaera parvula Ellin514]|uniref:Uncharacterized protein n=1 Tax=Pedosphaera parvula (strain Ellin514) TaxID=320771 RepID=B9XDC2_PEDPL|nr:hypothetical protein Cflav_PD6343 [Pedosphaera parvula Ellin514]